MENREYIYVFNSQIVMIFFTNNTEKSGTDDLRVARRKTSGERTGS
jgi:hypothetical protein